MMLMKATGTAQKVAAATKLMENSERVVTVMKKSICGGIVGASSSAPAHNRQTALIIQT